MTSLKLAHISDLHFCAPRIKEDLTLLTTSLRRHLPIELEIGFHDTDVTNALRTLILQEDPDVIVITGDITTFGDMDSFNLAYEWLEPLLTRGRGQGSRPCVVVPGNHDVLQAQFSHLLHHKFEQLPWYVKKVVGSWLKDTRRLLKELTRNVRINSPQEIFNHFQNFAQRPGLTSKTQQNDLSHGQRLFVHPFRSVSTNPIWMNLGTSVREEISKLNSMLSRDKSTRSGELHMLALHHNPISSANVAESAQVNAYNSMPAGVQLLRTVQVNGVDVVLHGHQHQQAWAMFDFDLQSAGHSFAVGVPSSGVTDNAGCNFLEVEDINHLEVQQYNYHRAQDRFERNGKRILCLERNRPVESKTSTVRYEIKAYVADERDGNEADLWNEILKPGSQLIYISGRKLSFVTDQYLKEVNSLLNHNSGKEPTRLRLLVSNPALLRNLIDGRKMTKEREYPWGFDSPEQTSASIWGIEEDLETLAAEAEKSLNKLKAFIDGLSAEQRRRINVRIAHTLLPFAATVRDANRPWGKMVVRLLPVGAIGDLSNPVMKLHRRTERALYDHFFTHLKYLLAHGKTVLGDWDMGIEDLRLEGLAQPNP